MLHSFLNVVVHFSEKAMATHSSTLAWKIPWTEEPGGLQSMRWRRVRHDWATSLSLFTFMLWRRKWQPTPVLLPGKSRNGGAWWAAIYGVAHCLTRLKWLSSSSSSIFLTRCSLWTEGFKCTIPYSSHSFKWVADYMLLKAVSSQRTIIIIAH